MQVWVCFKAVTIVVVCSALFKEIDMTEKEKVVPHPIGEANEKSPFGTLSAEEFYARHSVSHSSHFITNARGIKLFTQSWIPLSPKKILGTVAVVHSYTGDTNWFLQLTSIFLAESGFATCAIDHEGHGFSEGLQNHMPDIKLVVDDCISFFDSFRSQYPLLPSFLYAESLGGAIALLIHLRGKQNDRGTRPWDGIVLNSAMCGVSEKIKPPWPVQLLLSLVATVVPTWEIVPTKANNVELSYKEEWKQKLRLACPTRSTAKARAGTMREILRMSGELQGRFEEVDLPLLIVHGEKDVVCDPACAEELYRRASSKDKTLRIYPGMLHQIIGEPQENVDLVFGDLVDWLQTQAKRMAAQ